MEGVKSQLVGLAMALANCGQSSQYVWWGATGSWVVVAFLLLVKAVWMALPASRRWARCPTDM
jgi:uncharacterized membrane protein